MHGGLWHPNHLNRSYEISNHLRADRSRRVRLLDGQSIGDGRANAFGSGERRRRVVSRALSSQDLHRRLSYCYERSRLLICPVPSGSTVELNGSVETPDGAAVTCTDTCLPSQYTLLCYGPSQADKLPDPSLDCQRIAAMTTGDEQSYCCPCSP
jgi:hypothetical protein